MIKPELLAPAGNLQKLKLAFLYGADAVYVGGKEFSLRAYADNFTNDELFEAVTYAHGLGKKVYVTVNIFAKNADLAKAKDYFLYLKQIHVDAVLITDPALFVLAKEADLTIHISTQANTLNALSAKFWHELGAERVVLARELSLTEIATIHRETPNLELETFVHGAMCVSYSGRCLLSNYLTKRDGNRGECVQACRWSYTLTEQARHKAAPLEVEEDARGTYFLNSKDLNLLANLPALLEAGVLSFKIEGRMKTGYYLATVVNAYRRALDEFLTTGHIQNLSVYEQELQKISHRPYTKGNLLGNTDSAHISLDEELSKSEAQFVGVVLADAKEGSVLVEMRNRFRVGDTLEVLSPNNTFLTPLPVTAMHNQNGEPVADAKLVQEKLFLKTDLLLKKDDILRLPSGA